MDRICGWVEAAAIRARVLREEMSKMDRICGWEREMDMICGWVRQRLLYSGCGGLKTGWVKPGSQVKPAPDLNFS